MRGGEQRFQPALHSCNFVCTMLQHISANIQQPACLAQQPTGRARAALRVLAQGLAAGQRVPSHCLALRLGEEVVNAAQLVGWRNPCKQRWLATQNENEQMLNIGGGRGEQQPCAQHHIAAP